MMNSLPRSVMLTILCCCCMPCFAIQDINFEWISDRDGLSQNTVRCILQDRKGFLWLGTINGLNRYNGREFIVMNTSMSGSSLVSDYRIRSLSEDKNGYIWARTMANTFICYDPQTERFVDFESETITYNYSKISILSNHDVWLWGRNGGCSRIRRIEGKLKSKHFSQENFGSPYVYYVYQDSDNCVWICTENGVFFLAENDIPVKFSNDQYLFCYEYDGHLFFVNNDMVTPFNIKNKEYEKPIYYPSGKVRINTTTAMKSGLVLITTRNDTYIFDAKTGKFLPSETVFKGNNPQNATFYTDNKGNTWIYNLTGTMWRQSENAVFEKIRLIPPEILATIDAERFEVWQDSRDIIWITTYGNGLFAIEPSSKITHFTTANSELPTDFLLSIFEDNSGEIWVGSEFSGLIKISLNNYAVKVLNPDEGKSSFSRSNAVRMIFQDSKNRFWIGTRNSFLHIYDSTLTKKQSRKIEGGLPFSMVEDYAGRIWLGTRGSGIKVFDQQSVMNCQNYHLTDHSRYSGSENVFDILIDSKNRIWAATFGGGLHYANIRSSNIAFSQISLNSVNLDQTRVILQDKYGIVWVGTNEGIVAFNPDSIIINNSSFLNFKNAVDNDHSLSNNEVKAIYEDSEGRLWFGTTGGGLNLLMREDPLIKSWFKRYTSANGLSNEVIQAILEDEKGNLWVSTEGGSGISKFNPQTESFENFSFMNGKQSGLFNEGSRWRMKNGNLMFGGYTGVYIFDPEQIKYDDYTPPIVITGLKINGDAVQPGEKNSPLVESITQTSEIRLKYNQNSFNIEFAMLNFHSPEYNQYSYYLDGFEKNQNQITRHNVAAYRNVPPGDYIFKVKGSNSFGVWTDNETYLKIIITPPFWKSFWAYIIYIMLVAAAIFFSVRIVLKINRLHTEVEVEKQLTEYKLRFFTNISHEFRTPLTIIRGALESLSALENMPSEAHKSIAQMNKSSSRLMRLIDQLLDFRKLQNKGLELQVQRTDIVGFFSDIFYSFKEIAEKKGIAMRFASKLDSYEMLLDRGKFDKIAYNLMSNAIKYTPENGIIQMKINLSDVEDRMILSVSDSGKGVPKEKQSSLFERFSQFDSTVGGSGVGLHLTSELAAVHRGKVEYIDSELGGACFIVSIPLSDVNYAGYEIIPTTDAKEEVRKNNFATEIPENEDVINIDKKFGAYRILVIEDEDEVREFVTQQLEKYFTVVSAHNGVEGMESASKEQPDLIICDVMMPGVDGYEVTIRLKADFLTSHIPVILLTAHSSEEYQLEGVKAGADAYIIKPFSVKYLITRIVKLIEQREKLRRKFAMQPGVPEHLITFTDRDKEFLGKIDQLIEKNIENFDFSIDEFAKSMGMGRTNFFKKVKGITGHSPNEYLRIVRMKKAAELLETTNLNVSEVSYRVGINDPFYFSKCFKTQFGQPPSHYQKK